MSAQPTVGRIVHYVSHGTPNGEYPSACRAAIITEVSGYAPPEYADDDMQARCHIAVMNPTGMFFNEVDYSPQNVPGTWHWPEQANAAGPTIVNITSATIKDEDHKSFADEVTRLVRGWPRIERQPVEYHWMITYLVPKLGGFYFRQKSGLCQPEGRTRGEMFEVLAQQVMDEDGLAVADFSVVYFGLEPNRMDVA